MQKFAASGIRAGMGLLAGVVLVCGSSAAMGQTYQITQVAGTDFTEVRNSSNQLLATYTQGCYTVTLAGSSRTFSEPSSTAATVTHSTWVRVLPAPFNGTVDQTWLTARLADTSPDVLKIGMQYIAKAPAIKSGNVQIAGDASYGPLQADGTRQEGSDFNDYLGAKWTYPTGTDAPETDQFRCLDCSGMVRMIYGYRGNIPMILDPDGLRLPRRSFQIYASAPGKQVIVNTGVQATDLSKLRIGDLVFFDADTGDGTQLDHVGVSLGLDSAGASRFLSSRKSIDGPTMGDKAPNGINTYSYLNGTGYYAKAFRCSRRL